MTIEEMFFRQIDSVDGNIEISVHAGELTTCVSFGPFVWHIDSADRDQVIELVATVMANPARATDPIPLEGGELLQIAVSELKTRANGMRDSLLWINSGCANVRLHFGTASLLMAALCEARYWQRTQLLSSTSVGKVASC